ncbi:MAG: hypothetical protein HW416_1168 [Chloroflexi bacterium]|nr:hypothetical protein [Chloroflexota bacterium]
MDHFVRTDPGPWTSVAQAIAGNLLLRLGNAATGTLMGLLLAAIDRQRGDVPALAVGLMAASFYLAELIGAPWFGARSDRMGIRRFMIAGPICGGIAVQLIGWPSLLIGWPLLLVAMGAGRVIEGLSTATSAPSTLSFLTAATSSSAPVRARVMAWYEMATVVGIGGGVVAGGILWDQLGHASFVAVTAVYGLSLICFLGMRDIPRVATSAAHRTQGSALLTVVRRPRLMRFVPAWLLVNTVVGLWFTHSAFQLTGHEQTDQHLAGALSGTGLSVVFAVISISFMVGMYGWGQAIGTRRKTDVMLVTLGGFYVISLALATLNRGPIAGVIPTLALGAFVLGIILVSGFTPAALAYLADISEEMVEHRGAVMGLYSVMLGLGQLLGAAIGGFFANLWGVDGLIALTALLGSGAVVTVGLLRRFENDRPRQETGSI